MHVANICLCRARHPPRDRVRRPPHALRSQQRSTRATSGSTRAQRKSVAPPPGSVYRSRGALCHGAVAEWLKAAVLKTAVRESVPGVRIPPAPFGSMERADCLFFDDLFVLRLDGEVAEWLKALVC